jgi:putative membrane protein
MFSHLLQNRESLLKFASCAIFVTIFVADPAASQPTVAVTPLSTADFVRAFSSMCAFEQRAGKIAGVMGTNLEVRRYSHVMVDDHAQSASALLDAAAKAGLPAPSGDLAASQTASVKVLYAVAPKDFDKAYMTDEVDTHQQALAAAQAYAANGDNPAVKSLAAALVPVIQRHLDQGQVILGHVR